MSPTTDDPLGAAAPLLATLDREFSTVVAGCSEANPLLASIEQPGVGRIRSPGSAHFSAVPRLAPRPAPRLGEHTEQVLGELLGIGGAAFGKLHDKGLVGA
jgi:2-methylfumaryl-CoA isomerase